MNNYYNARFFLRCTKQAVLSLLCILYWNIENIAQELHTIEGSGGFNSSTGITITHNSSYNLGSFPISDYAEGRLWNNGKNINLQHGTNGSGSRLSLSSSTMLSYANSYFHRKVSGSELRMAFEWGVEFSQLENGWGLNSDRPWLKQGWRGDNSIDTNGASGDYIYLGSSGNRDNANQFALMLSQGGIAIGRGDNTGGRLSDVLIKFKNIAGRGRVITDELEIRGGADLAENFDIIKADDIEIQPGNIVSISDEIDGKLELCSRPFDKRIVGVVSGANGVSTGMYMGQDGTLAHGDYPIALTGRVYVKTNRENGIIRLGDFLTSSSRAGEAMKVTDMNKAQGAIIGKAMTKADDHGFVLVLVNLQ